MPPWSRHDTSVASHFSSSCLGARHSGVVKPPPSHFGQLRHSGIVRSVVSRDIKSYRALTDGCRARASCASLVLSGAAQLGHVSFTSSFCALSSSIAMLHWRTQDEHTVQPQNSLSQRFPSASGSGSSSSQIGQVLPCERVSPSCDRSACRAWARIPDHRSENWKLSAPSLLPAHVFQVSVPASWATAAARGRAESLRLSSVVSSSPIRRDALPSLAIPRGGYTPPTRAARGGCSAWHVGGCG